jgi:hypothetical protein
MTRIPFMPILTRLSACAFRRQHYVIMYRSICIGLCLTASSSIAWAEYIEAAGGVFTFEVLHAWISDPHARAGEHISASVDAVISFLPHGKAEEVKLVQLIKPQNQWINERERDRAAHG